MQLKFLLLGLSILFISANSIAQIDQAALDSSIRKGNIDVINAINKSSKDISDVVKTSVKPQSPINLTQGQKRVSAFIAFLPVTFFLLIILVILVKSKRNDITLREILLDKDLQLTIKKEEAKVDVANAKANESFSRAITARAQAAQAAGVAPLAADAPIPDPAVTKPNDAAAGDDAKSDASNQQSISRLLALISGVTSVALAACVATFYMYRWSLGDTNPDIGHLSTVLYGLGLGVIPYGFNKVASALR